MDRAVGRTGSLYVGRICRRPLTTSRVTTRLPTATAAHVSEKVHHHHTIAGSCAVSITTFVLIMLIAHRHTRHRCHRHGPPIICEPRRHHRATTMARTRMSAKVLARRVGKRIELVVPT